MSAREWKPGDVALVAFNDNPAQRAVRSGGIWTFLDSSGYGIDRYVTDARALVVIDPEDREQVERLVDAFRSVSGWASGIKRESATAMQAALREFANSTPPKPTVYEHLVHQRRGKTSEAVCGKTWIPDPEVIVVGRCPECLAVAAKGWTA